MDAFVTLRGVDERYSKIATTGRALMEAWSGYWEDSKPGKGRVAFYSRILILPHATVQLSKL